MGFEPTTFSLARRRSTTELHPRSIEDIVKPRHSQASPVKGRVGARTIGAHRGSGSPGRRRAMPGPTRLWGEVAQPRYPSRLRRTVIVIRHAAPTGRPWIRPNTPRVGPRLTVSARHRLPCQYRDWAAGGGRLLSARHDGRPRRDSDPPWGTWGDASVAPSGGRGTRTRFLEHAGCQRKRGDWSGVCRNPGSLSDPGRRRGLGAGQLLRVPGKGWRNLDLDRRVSGAVISRRLNSAHSRKSMEASKARRMR